MVVPLTFDSAKGSQMRKLAAMCRTELRPGASGGQLGERRRLLQDGHDGSTRNGSGGLRHPRHEKLVFNFHRYLNGTARRIIGIPGRGDGYALVGANITLLSAMVCRFAAGSGKGSPKPLRTLFIVWR